ncbi:methyltransferase [Nibricoccus sp. IMCC34717]|uniref:methyltransferase n=1 Tax=Nibricoccus sp. IMCC34717 TaxID=3034021 RepID=UPI00384F67B8
MTSLLTTNDSSLQLRSVSFFGRTFDEYVKFFALDVSTLRNGRVLDVAAGPSSFTAEANQKGIAAVAVDPLYGSAPEGLEQHIAIDYRAMFARVRAHPELFRFHSFGSFDEAEASRRAAARRFLCDYGAHFVHDRYVGAGLPDLPFEDRSFDLVLCAHFLFTYGHLLSYAFHLQACLELVRVCAKEVRLHPVVGVDGLPYPELERLRRDLETRGVASAIVQLDYEFFSGADSMLVLRRV